MTDETVVDTQDLVTDTPAVVEWSATIEDTKTQLAEMYLMLLDSKKGGIVWTVSGLGVNLNPLKKDAINYLTSDTSVVEKSDIFSNIGKNIKKALLGKITWWTFLEYDQASLDKMKALILANKDNQTKLQELIDQIASGIDPTTDPNAVNATQAVTAWATTATWAVVAEYSSENTSTTYVEPFEKTEHTFISSPFGPRNGAQHEAIDITAPIGTEVKSITGGEVVETGYSKAANYFIKIQTPDKKKIITFVHLAKDLPFKKWDTVKPDDVIGYIGAQKVDQHRSGPHLHLGVYDNVAGKFVDPEKDDDLKDIIDDYPKMSAA